MSFAEAAGLKSCGVPECDCTLGEVYSDTAVTLNCDPQMGIIKRIQEDLSGRYRGGGGGYRDTYDRCVSGSFAANGPVL